MVHLASPCCSRPHTDLCVYCVQGGPFQTETWSCLTHIERNNSGGSWYKTPKCSPWCSQSCLVPAHLSPLPISLTLALRHLHSSPKALSKARPLGCFLSGLCTAHTLPLPVRIFQNTPPLMHFSSSIQLTGKCHFGGSTYWKWNLLLPRTAGLSFSAFGTVAVFLGRIYHRRSSPVLGCKLWEHTFLATTVFPPLFGSVHQTS